MKNKTLWQSIKCALQGLKRAFIVEKNFKTYAIIVCITMIMNLLIGFSARDYIAYAICVCGVFSAECLNTAAELICDFLTGSYEEKIRDAKDIAAAGVIIWGAAFWITEIILIGENFFG